MRVLMFGWEFPPHISGGLGTACHGMTSGLCSIGTEVIFVVPFAGKKECESNTHITMKSASGTVMRKKHRWQIEKHSKNTYFDNLTVHHIESFITPYATETSYSTSLEEYSYEEDYSETDEHSLDYEERIRVHNGYGKTLFEEVYRYAQAASVIAMEEDFDVIHAHDWMTFPAAVLAKTVSKKPLVLHVHATEFDRNGQRINQQIYDIGSMAFENADIIIAVSDRTKQTLIEKYNVNAQKIRVVYNAVEKKVPQEHSPSPLMQEEKRVLFMARMTYQKGPEYFVEAARLVLDKIPNARFIMAGNGDLKEKMIEQVAKFRMGSRFHFPGFMKAGEVEKMYSIADVYVMPSVSEPFGIAPLEAIVCKTPVLLSKQSGVGEILEHSLKVDFWDVDELANKICAVLNYPTLSSTLIEKSVEELENMSWQKSAISLNEIYTSLLPSHQSY